MKACTLPGSTSSSRGGHCGGLERVTTGIGRVVWPRARSALRDAHAADDTPDGEHQGHDARITRVTADRAAGVALRGSAARLVRSSRVSDRIYAAVRLCTRARE